MRWHLSRASLSMAHEEHGIAVRWDMGPSSASCSIPHYMIRIAQRCPYCEVVLADANTP
jgi:hypothetical protein